MKWHETTSKEHLRVMYPAKHQIWNWLVRPWGGNRPGFLFEPKALPFGNCSCWVELPNTLWKCHRTMESHHLIGKPSMNGCFSLAMWIYQRECVHYLEMNWHWDLLCLCEFDCAGQSVVDITAWRLWLETVLQQKWKESSMSRITVNAPKANFNLNWCSPMQKGPNHIKSPWFQLSQAFLLRSS